MSPSDDVLAASKAFTTSTSNTAEEYDRNLHRHATLLRRATQNQDSSSLVNYEDILDNVDPSKDSITYLLTLHFQVQAAQGKTLHSTHPDLLPTGKLWQRITYYLENFEPVQARYVGQEWRQLVEAFAQVAQSSSQPLLVTQTLQTAILRLDPSSAVLTSTHLLFIDLCLQAKAYNCALPVLRRPICHISSSSKAHIKLSPFLCENHQSSLTFLSEKSGFSSTLSYREYLKYFLYGGMIFMAVKDWRNASHFLKFVITMPPSLNVVSKIMIEAYKKWILVGLLDTGKVPPPPSVTPSYTNGSYQVLAKSYIDLARAFERGDMSAFQKELNANQKEWAHDHNAGLIAQVRQAFTLHFLKQTKKTFAALTIPELLEFETPLPKDTAAAESIIASLITSGALEATLVHYPSETKDTMLRFSTSSASSRLLHEVEIQTQLRKEKLMLEILMDRIDDSNRNLALSDELIDHFKRGQSWAGSGDGNGAHGDGEIEEDIMVEYS